MKPHFSAGRDAVSGDIVTARLEHYRIDPSLLEEEADLYRSVAESLTSPGCIDSVDRMILRPWSSGYSDPTPKYCSGFVATGSS